MSSASATPPRHAGPASTSPAADAKEDHHSPHAKPSLRGPDSASAAHAEQQAFETLWRVVYSSTLSWDRSLRLWNTLLFAIAAVNFVVVVTLFQGCWNHRTLEFSLQQHCETYRPSQIASIVCFVAFIAVLCAYYRAKAGYKAYISHFPSRWSAFTHSGLMRSFCLEVLAALVQPFPLLFLLVDLTDAQYLVLLTLFARLYLLGRLLRDWSSVYRKRMFIKRNTRFDTSFFGIDFGTVMTTFIYTWTTTVVCVGVALNGLLLAYTMHLCEREWWIPQESHTGLLPLRYRDMKGSVQNTGSVAAIPAIEGDKEGESNFVLHFDGNLYYQSPYVSISNALYFCGIVATTTGLGDIAPVTQQGKLFAVVTAFMGIAWSSFVVAVLTNKLVPSDFQAYVIDYVNRSALEKEKKNLAARLIQKHWRLSRHYRALAAAGRPVSSPKRRVRFTEELTPLIRQFHSVCRKEQNQSFIFNEPPEVQADVLIERAKNEGSAPATTRAPLRNDQLGRMGVGLSSSVDSSPLQLGARSRDVSVEAPLNVHRAASYGSADASSSSSRALLPVGRPRSNSDSARRFTTASQISAKGALKALYALNRLPSKSSPSLGPTSAASYRATSSSSGLSTNALQMHSLLQSQVAMQSHIAALERKLDQLLARGAPANAAAASAK